MAETNFTTAKMLCEDLAEKKKQILAKAGNVLSEACMSRIKEGKATETMIKDCDSIIQQFSPEDRVIILEVVILNLAKQVKPSGGQSKSRSSESDYFNDIFGNRRR